MAWEQAIADIDYIRGLAAEMGGADRVARQHDGGRYTVRERIDKLTDPGSFVEAGPLVGAADYDANGNLWAFTPGGYVMGLAEIGGRPIAVGGDDFTISGGSPHDAYAHAAPPGPMMAGAPPFTGYPSMVSPPVPLGGPVVGGSTQLPPPQVMPKQ